MNATASPATGHHECFVVAFPDDAQQGLVDWVRAGIDGGARILHVESERQDGGFVELLTRHRIDAAALQGSGQLTVVSPDAAYLVDGRFDPQARYRADLRFIEDAFRDGWPSVRMSGEAVDALPYGGVEGLLALEDNVERLSRRYPVDCLCVSDRHRFGDTLSISAQMRAHPRAVSSPHLTVRSQPGLVAASGEIDATNADLVDAQLATATPNDQQLVVDLSAVRFVDVAGARRLQAHAARPSPPTVRLRRPPPSLRRIAALWGWVYQEAPASVEPGGCSATASPSRRL